MREMRKDGLAIKRNAMGRQVDPHANNQVIYVCYSSFLVQELPQRKLVAQQA